MEFQAIVALTIVFELVTVLLRLLFKLRSHQWQSSIGMPRIHHGYIGMLFLLASYGKYAAPEASIALWIIGWALILSDLVHHYTVLPLLRVTEVDIAMQHYGLTKISIQRKILVALVGMLVVAIVASIATSLWLGALAMGMIYVSEKLDELLPKFRCPQELARYF